MNFVAEGGKPKRIWASTASNIGNDCRGTWQESLHNSLRSLELKLPSGRTQPFVFGVFSVILLYRTSRMMGHCRATGAFADCSEKPGNRGSLDKLLGASPDKSTA